MKKVGLIFRESLAGRVKEGIEKRGSTFVVSYSKLSASQLSDFRKDLKKVGAQVFVSRNTVAKVALKELKQETLADKISGQTAFVWTDADSAEVSKALVKFTKQWEGVVIQGGLLDGSIFEKSDIQRLSDLPSRQALLSQLLGVLQSPITGLMGALNGKTRELINLLQQLSEQKGGK